jgi:hypothetical protein
MNRLGYAFLLSWLLLAAFCLHGAAADFELPEDETPAADPEDGQPGEAPVAGTAGPELNIPLDPTLRFIIQPTILGLVPPRGLEGYGEVFVRVVEDGRNSITVHYEIKEEVPAPPGEDPDYRPGSDRQTQIRRGEITASGMNRSTAILPPLYWGDGALATDSSLLWLSTESFEALSGGDGCPLDLRYTGPAETAAAGELATAIDELAAAAELEDGANFSLTGAEPVLYPCVVNGERTRLAALHARDSLGLAEYWVLDDSDNPLVLKLTYTLGDGGDAEDLSFVEKGGGYAITSIDFSPDWQPGR